MNRHQANALAHRWATGQVAPEDFDPSIKEWKLEKTVRELVKTGDLDQRQVVEEVQRRARAGYFSETTEPFEDKFKI